MVTLVLSTTHHMWHGLSWYPIWRWVKVLVLVLVLMLVLMNMSRFSLFSTTVAAIPFNG